MPTSLAHLPGQSFRGRRRVRARLVSPAGWTALAAFALLCAAAGARALAG